MREVKVERAYCCSGRVVVGLPDTLLKDEFVVLNFELLDEMP